MSLSLADVGRQWFEDAVDQVIEWFTNGLTDGYESITDSLFNTPTPDTGGSFVFGAPHNEPWVTIYGSLVGGEIMLISLLILVACIQARHTLRIFNFGSQYESRKTRRSAWTGGILIVTWYWIATLTLYLVDGFSFALVPSVGNVTDPMIVFLTASVTNPGLAFILVAIGGIAMWALQALFFLREILLYVFIYGMPVAVAVAYGNLPVLSQLAHRVAIKFVPLAVMPLPVALLFRGYELLFASGTSAAIAPDSAFFRYLVAVSLPVLSVWIVWKLFTYATPRLARTIRMTVGGTATVGAIAGASAVAGPWAGATAARWGPKAAVGHTVARSLRNGDDDRDAAGRAVTPSYRRTENDRGPGR